MKKSSLKSNICPVPLEQQPIYEYEQLKNSWFFSWATLDSFSYGKKVIWMVFWGGLFASPLSWSIFSPQKEPIIFSLFVGLGSILLTGFITIQFYLAWLYIYNRLNKESVLYEESGWYDGQIWEKPLEIINRDRLIITQNINPILSRLKKTLLTLVILIILGIMIYFLASNF